MSETASLDPSSCALILVDEQAGLTFATGSADRQTLRSNGVALARTAVAFGVPVVVSTSASKVYNGPLMPAFLDVLPGLEPIERRNMNLWEDATVRAVIEAHGRRTVMIAGLLTEACVSLPALSALADGYRVFVVADACGGFNVPSHDAALRRMEAAGATMTSWLQVLLEFHCDCSRQDTYKAVRSIVVDYGGAMAAASPMRVI